MKTIIEMAREAGLPEAWISETGVLKWSDLERFAALVRAEAQAEEREACAKVAEEHMRECEGASFGIGAAIRARGNT